MTVALATAADARYGLWLLNLLGSVRRRSDLFDRVVAYDLGLTPLQRRLLDGVAGVEVRTVPPFVPHWRQGRTWKTWIWANLDVADDLVWLDAGITVLRPLTAFLEGIAARGYFAVAQGHPLRDSVPSDYVGLYGLSDAQLDAEAIAAGILGFRRGGAFFVDVIEPTYRDAVNGRSLGFSPDELEKLNWGLDRLDETIVRDCRIFRHEQTLLGIHFHQAFPEGVVADLDRFGGWQSPRDHPQQVIWSHRRRGDYRFLPRVPYRPRTAPLGRTWGAWVFLRHQVRAHSWALRPAFWARFVRRRLSLFKDS